MLISLELYLDFGFNLNVVFNKYQTNLDGTKTLILKAIRRTIGPTLEEAVTEAVIMANIIKSQPIFNLVNIY